MHICFVDESGSAETLTTANSASTPVFTLVGLVVPGDQLRHLNWKYLQLKKTFNTSLAGVQLSELIQTEVKGADLRADIRRGPRNRGRRATGFLDKTVRLLEEHECRIIGRVIVKDPGVQLNDVTMYSSASSWLCHAFHRYLDERASDGLVLMDSRTKVKNTPSSVGMATQMFKTGGSTIPRLAEVPVFGHSDSHIALQIADVVASAIVFPSACAAFAMQHSWNHHAHNSYPAVRLQFGRRLQKLQYRYLDATSGQWRGGMFVTGPQGSLPAQKLFADPAGGTGSLPLAWPPPNPP